MNWFIIRVIMWALSVVWNILRNTVLQKVDLPPFSAMLFVVTVRNQLVNAVIEN